ncbi:MAG: dephospho-CoA kinase [Prevotellaceae bacterium]|jgi:dephospho-CoA kinase|nr:dephospho-CoA kinase [Prevotellaceae bacterium]
MKTVGITGGIGSGKTTLCKLIQIMGYPVFFADDESKLLIDNDLILKKKLIDAFGSEIYADNGKLNRSVFAAIIFENKNSLQLANSIIHPAVIEVFDRWRKMQTTEMVFVESAILFESVLQHTADKTIAVSAPEEIRIRRVIKRERVKREVVEARIRNQMIDEIRNAQADYIVLNDDKNLVIPQMEKIFYLLGIE